MLTAVATVTGADVRVHLHDTSSSVRDVVTAEEENPPAESQLNPIAPEVKEIIWGFGSFVVLAVLMRYVLYPRVRTGMDARSRAIAGGHEQAQQVTAAARSDVAQYEQQLAAIRTEAQQRVEAARATLEGERSDRLREVNARIGEQRAAAAAEVEAARAAAQADVESAVRTVAARAGELATGQAPSPNVVNRAVAEVMNVGVSR